MECNEFKSLNRLRFFKILTIGVIDPSLNPDSKLGPLFKKANLYNYECPTKKMKRNNKRHR